MPSGHFSFRFVICAFAAREMPEIARNVAVSAVTVDPETTTEKASSTSALIANSRHLATLRNKNFLIDAAARRIREGRPPGAAMSYIRLPYAQIHRNASFLVA